MVHSVFDKVFANLLARWHRYQDAPRDPARVIELAAARADLDDSRRETAAARTRHHPEFGRVEPQPPRHIAVSDAAYQRLRVRGMSPMA